MAGKSEAIIKKDELASLGSRPEIFEPGTMVKEGRYIGPIPLPQCHQHILDPFRFGENCGKEWVKTASSEALKEAAERETTKEQINRFYSSDGHIEDDEFFAISPPYFDCNCEDEIKAYFITVYEKFPNFQGVAHHKTDSEISMGCYSISGLPVAAFRLFEEGWTFAVREHMENFGDEVPMVRNDRNIGVIPCSEDNKHIRDPYSFGMDCGEKWVETASPKAIKDAAKHETAKEVVRNFFAGDTPYDDEFTAILPLSYSDCWGKELAHYFKAILEKFPEFQGYSDGMTDSELRLGRSYLSQIPVAAFRLFEEGWTEAVRDYWHELIAE